MMSQSFTLRVWLKCDLYCSGHAIPPYTSSCVFRSLVAQHQSSALWAQVLICRSLHGLTAVTLASHFFSRLKTSHTVILNRWAIELLLYVLNPVLPYNSARAAQTITPFTKQLPRVIPSILPSPGLPREPRGGLRTLQAGVSTLFGFAYSPGLAAHSFP